MNSEYMTIGYMMQITRNASFNSDFCTWQVNKNHLWKGSNIFTWVNFIIVINYLNQNYCVCTFTNITVRMLFQILWKTNHCAGGPNKLCPLFEFGLLDLIGGKPIPAEPVCTTEKKSI